MVIPNCIGCEYEYQEGLEWLDRGYDVAWEGLGERKHLLVAIFDKKGKCIQY